MATSPVTPVMSTPSKLTTILAIVNAALQGLTIVGGPVGAGAALGTVFENILLNALQAYQMETGQPIDLTKIPLETPVP